MTPPIAEPREEALKPCPFCGGPPEHAGSSTGWFWIMCAKCHADIRAQKTREAAISAWNTRPESAQVADARYEGASELETRLWGILDGEEFRAVPSDIVNAISRLCQQHDARVTQVAALEARVRELEALVTEIGAISIGADMRGESFVSIQASILRPFQRIALSIPSAGASPEAPSGAWPAYCIKPGTCSRHRACSYMNCKYDGQDIGPAIDAEIAIAKR